MERVTPVDDRPLSPGVQARAERDAHPQGDLPALANPVVRADSRAVPRADDGWVSVQVRLRLGGPPAGARPDHVAVVADDRAATSELLRLLAERRVGVALVIGVESVDAEVAAVVGWAATHPRVGVVVVHSTAACRDVLESALGHLEGLRAPVAVVDGCAGGPVDLMGQRVMHASTPVELADLALLVVSQPRLAGRQVAFVTNSLLLGHVGVNDELDQAGLFGPDLTQHAEQRSKILSPGTRMRGAVTALASDVGPQALLAVLTTLGERGVDAVVLALDPTPSLKQRDIDRVLRGLNRAIPHAVIVNVDSHPCPRDAPVPVFGSDGAAITALGELVHARARQAA